MDNNTPSLPSAVVFTDASFEHRSKLMGWAAKIIIAGKEPCIYSGAGAIDKSTNAELVAIREALRCIPSPHDVTLFSDSQCAINALNGKITKANPLVAEIKNIIAEKGLEVTFCHHSRRIDANAALVDTLSRRALFKEKTPKTMCETCATKQEHIPKFSDHRWYSNPDSPLKIRAYFNKKVEAKLLADQSKSAFTFTINRSFFQPADYEGVATRVLELSFRDQKGLQTFINAHGLTVMNSDEVTQIATARTAPTPSSLGR